MVEHGRHWWVERPGVAAGFSNQPVAPRICDADFDPVRPGRQRAGGHPVGSSPENPCLFCVDFDVRYISNISELDCVREVGAVELELHHVSGRAGEVLRPDSGVGPIGGVR